MTEGSLSNQTETKTEVTPSELKGWYDGILWSLRTMIAASRVLDKTEEEFIDLVVNSESAANLNVEIFKMLLIDENHANHRAEMAACARDRIIKAITAREDPTILERMGREIDYNCIVDVGDIKGAYVNDLRPDRDWS